MLFLTFAFTSASILSYSAFEGVNTIVTVSLFSGIASEFLKLHVPRILF